MNSVNAAETSGAFYRPVTIGSLTLPGIFFLAPVAGYSDRSFRSICVDWDADFTYTEMVSSEAYIRNSVKTEKLIARAYNERRYAVQIFGQIPTLWRKRRCVSSNGITPNVSTLMPDALCRKLPKRELVLH